MPTTAGFWIQVATDGINQRSLSEREATHLYALLSATMFDAQIGCVRYRCWSGAGSSVARFTIAADASGNSVLTAR